MQPLFLQPVFKERIWGGTELRETFGYDIPSERTGECWAISAHPHGPSVVKNGPFAGKTLDKLWKEQPELFGNPMKEVFPLLTKILDAQKDLSVQVHPDDAYAQAYENGELGKTECWYIVDCKEDAEIVFGHNADTKEELTRKINEGRWDELLRRTKIQPGDFFYVPSGTVHALCEGTLVLETQQSSDATYRLYDYGRRDDKGNLRELHLDKSIDVINIPHRDPKVSPWVVKNENVTATTFVQSDFFSVYKWDISGRNTFSFGHRYGLISAIDGEGSLTHNGESYLITKGENLIIPADMGEFAIDGSCRLIVSHE